MIDPRTTLGQIAAEHPGATQVFLRLRLDFCCGGGDTLLDASRAAGLDPDAVLADLKEHLTSTPTPPKRWDAEPVEALVAHILDRYHASLRETLPTLLAAARKVERIHAEKPTCPKGLADHLEQVHVAVLEHLEQEETKLFPPLQSGDHVAAVSAVVEALIDEHDHHGQNLRRTRELTADFVPPDEACATWRSLFLGLESLESELMEHIHLENNVLFPRVLKG